MVFSKPQMQSTPKKRKVEDEENMFWKNHFQDLREKEQQKFNEKHSKRVRERKAVTYYPSSKKKDDGRSQIKKTKAVSDKLLEGVEKKRVRFDRSKHESRAKRVRKEETSYRINTEIRNNPNQNNEQENEGNVPLPVTYAPSQRIVDVIENSGSQNTCYGCNTKFKDRWTYNHHVSTFKWKRNTSWIRKKDYKNSVYQLIICADTNCCKTFDSIQEYEDHCDKKKDIFVQQHPDHVRIFQIYNSDDVGKTGQKKIICGQCRAVFSTNATLKAHIQKSCQGKHVVSCEICNNFQDPSHSKVMKHILETHPQLVEMNKKKMIVISDLKLPAEHKSKLYTAEKNQEFEDAVREDQKIINQTTQHRTYSYVFTSTTSLHEVFVKSVEELVLRQIKYEVGLNKTIYIQFCIPAVIEKHSTEEATTSTRPFHFTTKSVIVQGINDIRRAYEECKSQINTLKDRLNAEGSGWSVAHCRRLDLTVMAKPGVRGGGGRQLKTSPISSILPKYAEKGLTFIGDTGDKCFKYACTALTSFRAIDEALTLAIGDENKAKNKTERSEILKEKATRRKQSKLYDKYMDLPNQIKLGELESTVALSDMPYIERLNPGTRFIVWYPVGMDFVRTHVTNTPEVSELLLHKKIVKTLHLVLSTYIDPKDATLTTHWFPITNPAAWAARSTVNGNGNKTHQNRVHVCPYCSSTFTTPTSNTGFTFQRYVKEHCEKFGTDIPVLDPADGGVVNPDGTPIKEDVVVRKGEVFTLKYLTHVSTCQFNTITALNMPAEGKNIMSFKKYGGIHHNRFTLVMDYETTSTVIQPMCQPCHEIYSFVGGIEAKKRVAEECKSQNHQPDLTLNCSTCHNILLTRKKTIVKQCDNCNEENSECCDNCENAMLEVYNDVVHRMVCKETSCDKCTKCREHKNSKCDQCDRKTDRCEHASSETLVRLDPMMFCAVVWDNSKRRIVSKKIYSGEDAVQVSLNYLYNIDKYLQDQISDIVPLDISTIPQTALDAEECYKTGDAPISCYACGKEYSKRRNQANYVCRDHDHSNGKFRGHACRSCNRKMYESRKMKV